MKVIDKTVKKNAGKWAKSEIQCLQTLRHPNIVNLESTHENSENVCNFFFLKNKNMTLARKVISKMSHETNKNKIDQLLVLETIQTGKLPDLTNNQ